MFDFAIFPHPWKMVCARHSLLQAVQHPGLATLCSVRKLDSSVQALRKSSLPYHTITYYTFNLNSFILCTLGTELLKSLIDVFGCTRLAKRWMNPWRGSSRLLTNTEV